jgi:hypothetical protein
MANTIQIKRSSTAGSAPTAGQLAQGELAVNLADKRMFTKNASNQVVELGGAGVIRARLNLNGSGGATIRSSDNVSSVTYFGEGSYVVNFTTALPDANYSAVAQAEGTGGFAFRTTTCSQYTTTALNVRVGTVDSTPTGTDNPTVSLVVVR